MAETTNSEKGLLSLLRQAFTGYNPDDSQDRGILLQGAGGYHSGSALLANAATAQNGTTVVGEQDWMGEKVLPTDRFAKYALLEEMVVEGVKTNIPLHQALIKQDDVLTGDYTIKWLEEWLARREA